MDQQMEDRASIEPFLTEMESMDSMGHVNIDPEKPKHSGRKKGRITLIFGVTVLFIFAVWGLVDAGQLLYSAVTHRAGGQTPAQPCHSCGWDPNEAERKGCKFDIIKLKWYPPHCIDQELMDEFQTAGRNGSWSYWDDGLNRVNESDLAYRKEPYWTTYEWHIYHCVFVWRQEWRALTEGRSALDTTVSGEGHTMHCGMVFAANRHLDEVDTKIDPKDA